MKMKKAISLMLAFAMIMSLMTFSVVSADPAYIINDDFGEGDVSGWTFMSTTDGGITTEAIDGDNYALVVRNSWDSSLVNDMGEYAIKDLNVTYEDGKDVIIETRTKHESNNSSYAFKINMTESTTEMGNYGYATWIFMEKAPTETDPQNSTFRFGDAPWTAYDASFSAHKNNGTFADKWYTTKLVIKGTTNKGTISVTEDATGITEVKENLDIDYTDGDSPAGITNLAFRSIGASDRIFVDYVRVKQIPSLTATTSSKVKNDSNVVLTFDKEVANINNAITFTTQAGVTVPAQISVSGNVVTINPDSDLTVGSIYKVNVNADYVENTLGYSYKSAKAFEIKASSYIVDEDFGAEAPSGWVALDYDANTPSTATFSTYEVGEGTGNYALKASSGNGTTYMGIKYLINGGEGIALADDKNVVIETKFSHMNTVPSQKTRLDFKVNMNATANGDRWIANASEAVGNHYYSVLGILEGSGTHSGPANRVSNAIVYDTASLGTTDENGWVSGMDAGNGWYTVKMEYKGKTGKADVTITDPTGKELKYTDIYAPFSGWSDSSAYVTETLKDIGFRSLSEGGRGAYDNIYVDYLRIYEKVTVSVSAPEKVEADEDITVTFTTDDEKFVNAVTVKGGDGIAVAGQKSYDALNKAVIINPENDLEPGTYTIYIDKDVIEEAGYIFSAEETYRFTVPQPPVDTSGYLVYEDFGAEAPRGWVALDYSADAPSTATFSTYEVGEGTGNYALKASSGNGTTTYMGIKYLINGGEGIALADDKNVVIETKFSHMNTVPSQKTRLDFKVNMNATANGDRWIANSSEAVGNHYYSVLGILENSGTHSGPANRVSNAIVYDTASLGTTDENGWVSGMDAGNGWYTVKMEYKGKTGKADVTITDPYGKELKYTDIYAPFNNWGNSTAYVTETLKDIGFRSLSEGGRGAYDNIYVDYLRIYEKVTVSVSAPEKVEADEDITVTFTTGDEKFVNAVTVKGADGVTVAGQKSYDALNKAVIINPENDLAPGTYTIYIDKAVIEEAGYIFGAEETYTFTVPQPPVDTSGYLVYEDFSAEAPRGWVALDYNADTPSTATFSTYEVGEGTGNYALKASSGNGTTYMGIKYLINGGEGIALADDKNVVIETKFSHMNTVPSQNTRLDFKVNMNATANGDRWIANASEAVGNHYYSVLGILEGSGTHSGPANRDSSGIPYDLASLGTTDENGWVSGMDAGNGWYTVKMEYKGKTGKADVTITDPYGKELKYTDIYAPFNAWNNSTAYVTETLKDIGFRSLSVGGRVAYDNIYVDYLKIYETVEVSASVSSEAEVAEDIKVVFTQDKAGLENAVTLKDYNGNIVDAVKSYDSATKTVTINPNSILAPDKTYKVVVDKTLIEDFGYTYSGKTEFDFVTYKYLINENFGTTVPNGWVKLNQSASALSSATISTEEVEDGNYALKISTTAGTDVAMDYLINNGEGLALEDDKNVIIETKFKHYNPSSRVDFKINMGATQNGDVYVANGNERFNYYYTVAALHETKGIHAGSQNRDANGPIFTTAIGDMSTGTWSSGMGWYTVKVTYKGKTGKADVVITDSNGAELRYTDIYAPFNKYNEPNTASVTETLKDIGFRSSALDSDGPRVYDFIWVDYLKVKEVKYLSANVPATVLKGQTELKVSFNFDVDGAENLVKLYQADGETLIATTNTYDKDAKTVTLTANANFADETIYIVKFDKDALETKGFNTDGVETSYTVTGSKYVLNDTFDNGLDGWELYNGTGQLSANDGFMNLTMTGENDTHGRHKQIAIKRFSSPIEHKDGKYTVVETRIKNTTGVVNTLFKVNINPEVVEGTWEQERSNYTLFGLGKNYTEGTSGPQNYSFLYPKGKAVGAYGNVLLGRVWDVAPDTINGTWFKVEARFDKENPDFVLLTVTNETTGVTTTVTADMRTWDGEGEVTDADYSVLKSFAVRMSNALTGVTETATVDYVRVSYEDKVPVDKDSYELKVVNANGEEVTTLEKGNTYYGHYSAETAEAKGVTFIIALYKNGVLQSVKSEMRSVLNHNNRTDGGFEIPADTEGEEDDNDEYEIKFYAWNDLAGLKPLTNAKSAKTE